MSVKYFQVAQGVWGMRLYFVNVYMIANRRGAGRGWVLVDTGVKGSAGKIIAMAEALFGPGTRPAAIILTHGHADHAGSVTELLKHWDVPVYAHKLELPYLTGRSSYPPADPEAGGGLMTLMSWLWSTSPINISRNIREIDLHDGIPELPEWKIIPTPGHSPGHISLFLPLNTTLIAGDAFTTTPAESAIAAITYRKKISGPPKYLTTDWIAAAKSVRKLAALQPRIAATGHGAVMRGRELSTALNLLANRFESIAVPQSGRYVGHGAVSDENGVRYIPPYQGNIKRTATILVAATVVGFLLVRRAGKVWG
ncbi:MBL fold metallo-hydrolase [Mucilaginibacter phyllosphaerae]|uniref:Glyoxylase-like metal-dependent hydrolase (Beta-lactamase superfamily II) n=1 Tax=Mucilaginibacter phyllosphaerae TaxID=1812349 RepID=A0A4Y8ABJ3_9SPHI|nr:MBL fold metallo-hydrolase [Mucilaginibacter phyllosphaerae]MBB3969261.1 glyoxylase-like metal-dependent hydrolase (beta-lactamase superfamily II) [Mucilaginibacter phyllosphaerae]TEW65941.1 MBL fold metallo-hydrolase [Mucilaginibacter phyllosphaerae]GGH07294.1 MBL fold metallo-hydrolase [Mucilaginibacter phyllosphaerae]